MAELKVTITETASSFDVDYGGKLTVVVPKEVADTKAKAAEYAKARWDEFKKGKKE